MEENAVAVTVVRNSRGLGDDAIFEELIEIRIEPFCGMNRTRGLCVSLGARHGAIRVRVWGEGFFIQKNLSERVAFPFIERREVVEAVGR